MARQPLGGLGRLMFRDFTISLTQTMLGRLLWTSGQPDTETSTWQNTTLTKDLHAPGGIQTHNPSKRATADPRLKPRGHWDRFG
jgi:hypothetical protein